MLERLLILFALTLTVQSAGAVTIYKFTDAQGVVSFSDRPTPGASVMVFRDRMVERIDQQVHLSVRREKGVHSLYVRNDLYARSRLNSSFPASPTCWVWQGLPRHCAARSRHAVTNGWWS